MSPKWCSISPSRWRTCIAISCAPGSDVIEAFTYYAHREKLRLIGRENDLEPMNRQALDDREEGRRKKATRSSPAISATPTSTSRTMRKSPQQVRAMFEEQVGWAVEAGVDFIIAETISWLGRGRDRARRHQADQAAVRGDLRAAPQGRDARRLVAVGSRKADRAARRRRGRAQLHPRHPHHDAVRRADPPRRCRSMSPRCRSPTAPPRPSRLRIAHREGRGLRPLHSRTAARSRLRSIRSRSRDTRSPSSARRAHDLDVRYLGVCCGAGPHHIRALAEALGRRPPASRFSADMSKHYSLGTDPRLQADNREFAKHL